MYFHQITSRKACIAIFCSNLLICGSTSAYARSDISDPYENVNRKIWNFNTKVDKVAIKPAAKIYRTVTPKPLRNGITNALNNLQEPFTVANNLLQGKVGAMFTSASRFVINSTVGIAGFTDPATKWGLKNQVEDFGQTLAVWGLPEGPYLVLPFLGPSNPRDTVGTAVKFLANPIKFPIIAYVSAYANYGRYAMEAIDLRSRLLDTADKALDTSTDPYATVRSAYHQRREYLIHDGNVPTVPDKDDIFGEDTNPEDGNTAGGTNEAQQLASLQTGDEANPASSQPNSSRKFPPVNSRSFFGYGQLQYAPGAVERDEYGEPILTQSR